MAQKTNLAIRIISQDSNDTSLLADELNEELSQKAQVELTTQEAPALPDRGIDTGTVMQVIMLGLTALQTAVTLAQVLYKFKAKGSVVSIVIENTQTNVAVRISGKDSLQIVKKKTRRVVGRRRFLGRLFRR